MKLSEKTTKELIEEYSALEDMIYNIGCYGTRDMRLLSNIGNELVKRGYEPEEERTLTKWTKEK